MYRLTIAAVLVMLSVGMAAAATVGYVTYGGLENPAVNDEDGWVQAMREAGLTVELIKTTDLPDPATLAHYNALYIPGTIAFTEAGFAALQKYVQRGGYLLLEGYYSATSLDTSGENVFVKDKHAWKIIYLEKGACRTGILPATGAGARGSGVTIAKLRLADGFALTEGTETGTVLDMPRRPNGKPYLCATLHYFPAIGARPLISGVPEATEDNQQPEPVVLAVYNEYGSGKCLWVTLPLAEMAADGVEFARMITSNIISALVANPAPPAEELAGTIPTVEEAMADLKAYDVAFRGGKGYSDSPDSDMLGWAEASRLLMYMKCYRVSQDAYWLDKLVDHFDRMIANLSDPDGDGYLGWSTITYSDALGWPKADENNQGNGEIAPELVRARKNTEVTGHTYTIEFVEADKFDVIDTEAAMLVAREELYKSGAAITAIPGIKVTISGTPAKGDKFEVHTEAVIPLEWACHDGTITYPLALFVETVKKDEALHEQYGEKADEYAKLLTENFLKKWDYVWVEPAEGMGFLKWEPLVANPYLRSIAPAEIPNTVRPIPHNQYLALGRTYLVMADVVEEPLAGQLRDKAAKMARYFKSKLRKTGAAYTFAYWDPIEELSDSADDISHGGLSLSFAIEAANRGLVFTAEDMTRFAHTLLDQIWNGSVEEPQFARRVNGEGKMAAAGTGGYWAGLCRCDDEVWRLLWAIFRQKPDANGFLTLRYARPEVPEAPPTARGGD